MMGGNMSKMLKQVQKMQADMAKVQDELKNKEVEASVGGGAVKVTVSGSQEVKSIVISPDAIDPDDIEMLQDLLVAAVNEAIRKSQDLANSEMSKIAGGLNMPGMPGLF